MRQAVLLVNLGSPNELNVSSIRKFLRKFLSDRRVVSLPRILWYPILYGIVLPFRAKRLIKQYNQIWLNQSSPLIYYTYIQQSKLQALYSDNLIVTCAFSYSQPELTGVLNDLYGMVDKLTILPLYPQFSSTTTMSVFDEVAKFYSDKKYMPQIKFIRDFHDNIAYIKAIANSIDEHYKTHGKPEKLVFSYHSLPERLIQDGDVYQDQCIASSKIIAKYLGINEDEYIVTFQSKFGKGKWITPATAATMEELAKSGINHIAVVCPGFISDCLETLEEIAITNHEIFMHNGGKKYHYIPCLNDSDLCIDMLHQIVEG